VRPAITSTDGRLALTDTIGAMATARPDDPDDAPAELAPQPLAEPRSASAAQIDRNGPSAEPDGSVIAAQRRLHGLLRANRLIIGDLTLPVVLRRIVEAACELVNARYGALGVLAPGGGLEQFINIGIDDDTVAAMGHLPEGKGLLGALIDDPRPIRLPDISLDARSVGFPPGHPDMRAFLGVPIRVRGEVYGNIYLSGYDHDHVSAEDEEMIASLAATAGVAIENARLFQEAHRRQEWLRASTEITRQLLASDGEEPLQVIARRLGQIADADAVNVVLPTADGRRLMVEVATGAGADQLHGLSYPVDDTVSKIVLDTGHPVLIPDMALEHDRTVHLSEHIPLGPLMVLPLVGMARTRGALIVGRLHGRPLFTSADLEMATTFANHAALALELADARSDRERVALLEDRDRIARDLHDHVIQRLFGAGLTVESIASGLGNDARVGRLSQVVDDIDETIRQIRTSIFRLRGPIAPGAGAVRQQMLSVVSELTPVLGYQPRISFAGPVDTAVPVEVIDDVVAVLREGLTNVARHAGASQVAVTLRYSAGELLLELIDNGIGMGDTPRRSGLANLRERAEGHGGSLLVGMPTRPGVNDDQIRGTMLRWSIPLS
jgi:signal transduction histidine kinase